MAEEVKSNEPAPVVEKKRYTDEELEEFKKDPNYFVSIQRTLFEKKGQNWSTVQRHSKVIRN